MTKDEANKVLLAYTNAATDYYTLYHMWNGNQCEHVELQDARRRFEEERNRMLELLTKFEVNVT